MTSRLSQVGLPEPSSLKAGATDEDGDTIVKVKPVSKPPLSPDPKPLHEDFSETSLAALGSSPPTTSPTAGGGPLMEDGRPPPARTGSERMRNRQVLSDLHANTHFGVTELESLMSHFQVVAGRRNMISKRLFLSSMGHAFGMTDHELLDHIFNGCDEGDDGYISFAQFASALSVIFRGDREEIVTFWFKMYDSDHDGFMTRAEFEELLGDVAGASSKDQFSQAAEGAFHKPNTKSALELLSPDTEGITFQEFNELVLAGNVLPSFYEPHQQAPDHQQVAFRDLTATEREVLALLGAEFELEDGHILIHELQPTARYFFFIMEGDVELRRSGILLATQSAGTFLGEAALFNDVKSVQEDGSIKFTTTVKCSGPVKVLQMEIAAFYPLVYQEHPGATAIVQRLGRVMMERFQQTEERLQSLLSVSTSQSGAGMRLSSKDWMNFRKRLMRLWSLRYHKIGRKGKLEIAPTKLVGTAQDLSLAYSPGVAEPCLSIAKDSKWSYEYTSKGHLVGVVTNGSAVLGLGNIGPLAAKPVMEGKAVLFKKFADLDAFDIEINMPDPVKFVDMVVAMEPTFGGINLEDIKAPECFYVEKEAQKRCNIPVFHDDQHGTAIIAGAGLLNALDLVVKEISQIRVVVCGCGAAGFTCAKYFLKLGVQKHNLLCVDVQGVVYKGREDLTDDNYLSEVAAETDKRTLDEAIDGADVFLGLSAANLLKDTMLLKMKRDPVVFALANPIPEIDYEVAKAARPDVIMATGRSDLPNQINNVCAFPFIFRGALDVRASKVNEEMKLAATMAIARLARQPKLKKPESSIDLAAMNSPMHSRLCNSGSFSGGSSLDVRHIKLQVTPDFGPDYIIPKPFDDRLVVEVTSAVAKAAISSGVASPGESFDLLEYRHKLEDLAQRLQA